MICDTTPKTRRVKCSAEYATGRERSERIVDLSKEGDVSCSSAVLSSAGGYSMFKAGGDTIRFATSPRLVKYTGVLRWEEGYLEVGADYGHGEEEDYIDIRQILDNLYYDTDSLLTWTRWSRQSPSESSPRTVDSHQHHFEERAVFAGRGVRAVGSKWVS